MSRTPFPNILNSYKVNVEKEIRKLYDLFFISQINTNDIDYKKRYRSMHQLCADFFHSYSRRGTILSLAEFDEELGFNRFFSINYSVGEELDYLIDFCEYVYNLLKNISFDDFVVCENVEFLIEHIQNLCESLNYVIHNTGDGMYFIVPSNEILDHVCEKMGDDVTSLIREFSHKTSKGDLAKKQQILAYLYRRLEPDREKLSELKMDRIVKNVFSCANNCDVRHNNSDQECDNYCANFDELTAKEKESIYDNLFGNIIVLLSAKIESGAINGLNDEMSKINRK